MNPYILLAILLVVMVISHYIIKYFTPVEELPDDVLEEKVIESYNAIQKVNDNAKAGKFKTIEDYKKAIDKVFTKYDPYLEELNKRKDITYCNGIKRTKERI